MFTATARIPELREHAPQLRPMDRAAAEFVLARNCVGRVAFVANGRVELSPIHYVFVDGAVFGRVAMGRKYLAWLVESEVVLEVDEVDALFDWRSVIVRGSVSLLARGADRAAWNRAVTAVRMLTPAALSAKDPMPNREFLFRIDPTSITGRIASTQPQAPPSTP